MANEYAVNRADLEAVAGAIREKLGTTKQMEFPSEFVYGINTLGSASDVVDGLISGTLSGHYSNDRNTKVRGYAFRDITITELTLPNVTSINDYAFGYCNAVRINLPNLTSTKLSAFANSKITDICLPKATSIYLSCFSGCTALKLVDLPSVTTINNGAFSSCSNLTTLILRYSGICTLKSTSAFSDTPIANGTGFVYVADEYVESYKTATNWVTYASQIKPLSELVTPPGITFTIAGKEYPFTPNTTWGEWVKRHSDEFQVGGWHTWEPASFDKISKKPDGMEYIHDQGDQIVDVNDIIVSNEYYHLCNPYGV